MSANNGHKPRKVRKYTDREKAAALAWLDATGGNVLATSNQLGIPNKTLDEWAKGRNQNEDVAKLREDEKAKLKQLLQRVVYELADVKPDEISKANLGTRFTGFGIVFDKLQLIDGKPTTITADATDWQETAERLAEKYGRPLEDVKRDLVKRKPELASVLIQ